MKLKRLVIVQNSIKTTYNFRSSYIKKLQGKCYIAVIAPIDDIIAKQKLESLGVKVYPVVSQGGILRTIFSIFIMNIFVIYERLKGSAFISHFVSTFIITYLSLIPFNKRVVVYVEGLGSIFSESCHLQKVLKFFLTHNSSIRLFCNCSERDTIGLNSDLVTGGIGVDLRLFDLNFSHKPSSKKRKLLFVGRLIKDKGIIDAISVMDMLTEQGIDVKLDVVGEVYEGNITSLTRSDIFSFEQKFGDRIEFHGYQNDVRKFYSQSDVLLLPSKREGFPVCVMEASAMGVPSVGYNAPGTQDAIFDNVNGYLSEYGNVIEMTECVKSIFLQKNKDIEFWSKKSRALALVEFDKNVKDNLLLQVLGRVF